MKKENLIYWIAGVVLTAILVFVIIKGHNKEKELSDPALFSPYISGYSSGVISKQSALSIELTSVFAQKLDKEKSNEDLFKLYPDVKGEIQWVNDRRLEFVPEKPLKSGETYYVEFNLDVLKEDIQKEMKTFTFKVIVRKQDFKVEFDELITTDMEDFMVYDLTGSVLFADIENEEIIPQIFEASIKNKSLKIEFEKNTSLKYDFKIIDIPRNRKKEDVILEYDGNAIKLDKEGEIKYEIPAENEFYVIDAKVVQYPEQYVLIQFSNPLLESQYLDGLIRLENDPDARFIIRNNIIKYIPTTRIEGAYKIYINEGVCDLKHEKLDDKYVQTLHFEVKKPELRKVHTGVIMPSGDAGLVFPFEAVNIKAVDVQISKIYENNILQFLQNNSYDGDYEMRRVSKPIKQTTIDLSQSGVADFGVWNNFTLDLNELIKTEPGAIYIVEIGFRQKHALYPCQSSDSVVENPDDDLTSTLDSDDADFWEYSFNDYTYGDYYYYDWELEEDPCSEYYYGYKNAISSNIFASDIGLIAKKGKSNEILAFTTNMLTAMPLSGAKVGLYNYQQQLISEGTTDSNGSVKLTYDDNEEAFFVIASNESQKAYLKLNYGETLSLSEFDVSGANNSGYKAFIFGERGVWRPGDSIYLSIILQEDLNPVPLGHPVVLEVTNPRNQLVYREVQNKNEWGYHTFRFKTDKGDITGNYSAKISVGGNTYWKGLPIETIKPNRLRVEMDFSKDYLSGDGDVTATLTARWLHGAVAKDLNAKVNLSLYATSTLFNGYEKYHFADVSKSFDYDTQELFDGITNENGQIIQEISFDVGTSAPGKCTAVLSTKVFEKGGNFSTEEQSIVYHPYSSYVGIRVPDSEDSYYLKSDKTYNLNIVLLDKDGNKIKDSRELQVSLFEYEWSWWYDNSDDAMDFASSNYNNAIQNKKVTIENGKGSTNFKLPNVDYGDFLIYVYDPVSKHSSSQILNVSSYSYRSYSYEDATGPQMLSLVAESDTVNVGDEILVKLPEGEGHALVCVENGTRVLSSHWVEVNGKNAEFKITATEEMTPNVYIQVSLLQPHNQTKNDHPIRMYGIIPIWVENEATHLYPILDMDDELEAESKVSIEVSEKNGMPMTYTIAMVDEGLLNLTHHSTPDPWSHFYKRDALGVTTWDMFDWVIGAFGIKVERLLSIGGGGSVDELLDPLKANRFKPMVKFIGPFYLEKGKTVTHEIQLPQYIGSVRTMIVVAEDHAYGSAEKTTPVTKPLMILGSLPRVLSPQEEVVLPITLFAMDPSVRNVIVEVETNNILSIDGASKQTVKFDKEGEAYINFKLKVNESTGLATVKLIAKSGMHRSEYDMELNVRYPNPPTTDVLVGIVNSKESIEQIFNAIGLPGTNDAIIEMYSIPPLNLEKRLNYLIRYPHGCIEQTVSAAFPQLYLDQLLDLDNEKKQDIQDYVNRAITKLSKYQLSNGGFSYWPGSDNVSYWGTNYAGHFLIEAQKAGYNVPNTVINRWVSYQKTKASHWTDDGGSSQLTQTYRLYTLALSGNPDKGAMNRLRQKSNLSSISLWRLAAAYQIIGKTNVASQIVSVLTTKVKDYNEMAGTFGSGTRDRAMILETLVLMGNFEDAFMLVMQISEDLSTKRWMSTQTTAYALKSIAEYVKDQPSDGDISCTLKINGVTTMLESDMPVMQHPLNILEEGENSLEVLNNTGSILYYRIILTGVPPMGSETDGANEMQMDVIYTYLDGTPIDITNIEQGSDFVATVKLKHTGYRDYFQNMALTQLFPSGWEIINKRMTTTDLGEQSYAQYSDIRDDRVYTYFNIYKNNSKTYKVLLNASFAGKYYLPAVNVEAMYDNTIYARKSGQWVEVKSVY